MYLEAARPTPPRALPRFTDSNHVLRQLRSLSQQSVFTADCLRSLSVNRLTT
jgi:hypothetical protein